MHVCSAGHIRTESPTRWKPDNPPDCWDQTNFTAVWVETEIKRLAVVTSAPGNMSPLKWLQCIVVYLLLLSVWTLLCFFFTLVQDGGSVSDHWTFRSSGHMNARPLMTLCRSAGRGGSLRPAAAPSSSQEVVWWSAFTSKWNVSVSRGLRSVPVREQEITTSVAPLLSLAHSNSNLLYWHDSNYAQYFQIQFVRGPHCGSAERKSKILIKDTPTQPWIIQQRHVVCHIQMFAAAPAEVWNRKCSVIWSVSVESKQNERLHSDVWVTDGHTWRLLHPSLCPRCSKVSLVSAVKQIFLLKLAVWLQDGRAYSVCQQPTDWTKHPQNCPAVCPTWTPFISVTIWFDRHKVYQINQCKESAAADGLTDVQQHFTEVKWLVLVLSSVEALLGFLHCYSSNVTQFTVI